MLSGCLTQTKLSQWKVGKWPPSGLAIGTLWVSKEVHRIPRNSNESVYGGANDAQRIEREDANRIPFT